MGSEICKIDFFKKAPIHMEIRELVNFGWKEGKGETFQLRAPHR